MAVIQVTNDNFSQEVLQEEKKVLLDFYATWCSPCQMLAPVVAEIEKEHPEYKVCKIDVDEQPQLAQEFQVMSIPTLVVMEHGKQVTKSVGYLNKDAVLDMLGK